MVHDLVKSAVHDGYIILWDGDCESKSTRSWMPLEDCVSGLIYLMNRFDRYNNRIWNIDGNFYTKERIAKRIKKFTGCEIFYSKKRGKYIQDFERTPSPKFEYDREISTTIKELIKYYEGTKHSSAIDWSK